MNDQCEHRYPHAASIGFRPETVRCERRFGHDGPHYVIGVVTTPLRWVDDRRGSQ